MKMYTLNEQYIRDRVTINEMTGCWNWLKARTKEGYGIFCLGDTNRKPTYAHRYMFELYNPDEFDPELVVMHKCDNTRCCNPDHLDQGTNSDNQIDAFRKRRQFTRLNPDLVRMIRSSKDSLWSLSKRLGVSIETLSCARRGRTWRWVV